MEYSELQTGPHFDRSLIGPDGKLARLHKGAPKPPPPIPPPVRETAKEVQDSGNAERKKAKTRQGYTSSLLKGDSQSPAKKKSLLG